MMGLLTVSKWELRRTGLNFRRKTLVFSIFLIILIAAVSFLASQSGIHINDNMYRIIVTDPDLGNVLKTDDRFDIFVADESSAQHFFDNGGFDLLITGKDVKYKGTEKSIAALDVLDKAILRYNEARLMSYIDLNNTFPVWITVRNLHREQVFQALSIQELPELEATPAATASIGEAAQGDTGNNKPLPSIREVSGTRAFPLKDKLLSTPSHLDPPIPFRSVVLSFLFIFPIYFIAQLYSASIMEERVRRKGELLLVSPISPWEIVVGKLLPYLIITLILMGGVTIYVGGNVWMLFIVLPIALIFLSTAFLGGIISRSFKELTFVLVFLSVILSGYIFLPAMFVNINAISAISPMTLVVKLLENEPVSMGEYVFSTIPFYLVSLLIFMFGIFIYREEDLFTQKPVKAKLLDSVQEFIERVPAPLFFLSIALLPLVYSFQMILIVLMFNLPIRYGIIIFIFLAAFIEEIVKSAGIYTVFSRKIQRKTTGNFLKAGIYAGAGFFIGEKLLLLAVIAGIAGSVFGSVMGIGLLVFPFLLHVTSSTVAAMSMRYLGTGNYLASVILATIVHSAYNLYIVRGVLFG